MAHDLVVRDGTVVTATETLRCDVGVDGGRITALGEGLPPGRRELDARGLYVLPGGIDSHVHIEQLSSAGVVCADDFHRAPCPRPSAAPRPWSLSPRSTAG